MALSMRGSVKVDVTLAVEGGGRIVWGGRQGGFLCRSEFLERRTVACDEATTGRCRTPGLMSVGEGDKRKPPNRRRTAGSGRARLRRTVGMDRHLAGW